ncbi:hypothetical protein VKT23_019541 [Stygiomarasmius scandens]|uniref:Uncharacterized protein n=1 Tax=Marasmiellus scandens TaxID=2682957 RepID=A0ABR1IND4_9AGAR
MATPNSPGRYPNSPGRYPNSPGRYETSEVDNGWLSIQSQAKTSKVGENPDQPYIDLLEEKDALIELGRIRVRALEQQVAELEEKLRRALK